MTAAISSSSGYVPTVCVLERGKGWNCHLQPLRQTIVLTSIPVSAIEGKEGAQTGTEWECGPQSLRDVICWLELLTQLPDLSQHGLCPQVLLVRLHTGQQ